MASLPQNQNRTATVTAIFLIVAQWPLAVAMIKALEGTASAVDYVSPLLVLVGVALWLARCYGWLAAPAVFLSTLLLTAANFIALRNTPLWVFLLAAAATAFLAALYLFARRHQAASIVAVVAALVAVAVLATEGVLATVERLSPPPPNVFEGKLAEWDDEMSSVLVSNSTIQHHKNDVDATYHTEADRSRRIPDRPAAGPIWALFGCSFTFGLDLNDEDTFAALLQDRNPACRIFDYGVPGHGTAEAYIALARYAAKNPNTALCIYSFLDDHVIRTACPDAYTALESGAFRPRFVLEADKPVFQGKAVNTLSLAGRFNVNLLRRSRLYRRFYPRAGLTDEGFRLATAMIREMQAACDRLPACRFLLVNLPTRARAEDRIGLWQRELAGAGIAVLDCSAKFERVWQQNAEPAADYFFIDGHPNRRYTTLVAQWIDEALRQWDRTGNPPTLDDM